MICFHLHSYIFLQFHKVRGELVAGHDAKNRPLMFHRVKQLVGEVGNLTAVNKLEMNSEGLLLLTNNNLLVSNFIYKPPLPELLSKSVLSLPSLLLLFSIPSTGEGDGGSK